MFRNSSVFRPAAAALTAVLLALGTRRSIRLALAAFALFLLPIPAYAENVVRLAERAAPLRDTRNCLLRVASQTGTPRGLYVDVPDAQMQHHTYYYFRALSPWTRADSAKPVDIAAVQHAITQPEPLLFSDARFRALVAAWHSSHETNSDFPPVLHLENTTVVLPGAYASCR
jgi:hypothetical protein